MYWNIVLRLSTHLFSKENVYFKNNLLRTAASRRRHSPSPMPPIAQELKERAEKSINKRATRSSGAKGNMSKRFVYFEIIYILICTLINLS